MPQNTLNLGIYRQHPEGDYNIALAYTYLSLVRFTNSVWCCIATGGAIIGESPSVQPSKWWKMTDGNAQTGPANTIPYTDSLGNVQFLPITGGKLTGIGTTPSFVPSASPSVGKRAVTKLRETAGSVGGLVFITDDDQIMSCGMNENALWSVVEGINPTPEIVLLNGTKTGVWAKVYGTRYNQYGVTSTGQVWARGANGAGQLGLGDTTSTGQRYRMFHLVPLAAVVTDLVIPTGFDLLSCVGAVTSTGTVWTWGNNAVGQLGLGDLVTRTSPVVNPTLSSIVKLACGGHGANAHFIAMTSAGAVWTWGYNAAGQLGQNDLVNRSTPTLVSGKTATDVSAQGFALLAYSQIIVAGALQTAGYNIQGAIGDNTIVSKSVFTPTTLAHTNVTKLVKGGGNNSHGGYITSINEGWFVGSNAAGELGSGNLTQQNVYFKPSFALQGSVADVRIADGGGAATAFATIMILTTTGKVFTCGYDVVGQMGNGGAAAINFFREVRLPEAIVAIDCGDGSVNLNINAQYALGASGRLYAWGGGTSGTLGNGLIFNSFTPVEVIVQ